MQDYCDGNVPCGAAVAKQTKARETEMPSVHSVWRFSCMIMIDSTDLVVDAGAVVW